MRQRSFWLVLTGTTLIAILASAFASTGPINDSGNVWEVRYHKTHPNKNGDIALRLSITPGTGLNITGILTRYNDLNPVDPKTKKQTYKKRTDGGGVINIKGTITKTGGGKNRKRESFELSTTYPSTSGQRDITVKGFHHTGRDRNSTADDSVCIRVNDKPHIAVKSAPFTVDCDEQPPDEDNLTEEDGSLEPEYDADNP